MRWTEHERMSRIVDDSTRWHKPGTVQMPMVFAAPESRRRGRNVLSAADS